MPDGDTEYGQNVAKTRKMLYDVPFEMLTFGTIFHPDLVPQNEQRDEDEAVERTESQGKKRCITRVGGCHTDTHST